MTLTDELKFSHNTGNASSIAPTSECRGPDCVCVNQPPDDSLQNGVIRGGVRLVGILNQRQGDCRYTVIYVYPTGLKHTIIFDLSWLIKITWSYHTLSPWT